ncbi:flippase [Amphritea sp. HPY]|uniref:flippase n=1 Tax=Amphritea sp. HPY TaxID=3421652 RepID=UPI003D7DD967
MNLISKKQLVKSFVGVGVMKLISIPISLLSSIILARSLGPEVFGQYSFVMALIALIALPVHGGMPQLVTREVSRFASYKVWPNYKGLIKASYAWVLGMSVLIIVLYCLSYSVGLISDEGKWSMLLVAIFIIPLTGLSSICNGVVKGLGLPVYSEIPGQLIQPILLLMFVAVMALFKSVNGMVAIWIQLISSMIVFFVACYIFNQFQPVKLSGVKTEYCLSEWGKALLPFSVLALVSTLNVQIAVVILGLVGTDGQVATMRIAERGSQFVVLSLTLVNLIIAPHIVRAYHEGNRSKLQKLAKQCARGSVIISLPIAIVLICWGEVLISITFGNEYVSSSYTPLVILVLAQLFNVFIGSVGHLLSMSGFERDTLVGHGFGLVINASLCLILSPQYGAVGAAIGVALGIVIWNLILSYMVVRRLGVKPTAL